jgi:ATP-dependent DNA helicase RecQ
MPRQVNTNTDMYLRGVARLPDVLEQMGYSALREGQETAVHSLLAERDTLCFLPTGGGKSAIYQVPMLAHQWQTLIFSPLVSLMQDQVDSMLQHGIPAGQVSSGQTRTENELTLAEWESGELLAMLVAPERMQNPRFEETMARRPPDMVVIDEAHTISQWCDSFRPDYNKIGAFITEHQPSVVLAITATATAEVEADIRNVLGILDAEKVTYLPQRSNLHFETLELGETGGSGVAARYERILLDALNDPNPIYYGSTIVYCSTRKQTHELYDKLKHQIDGGCLVYNGGMTPDERSSNQSMFMNNDARVMFATNAFGLGIDKPDIRRVIHADLPGSVDQYVQEAGRAGRDGNTSLCSIVWDPSKLDTQRWFIDTTYPEESQIRTVFSHLVNRMDSAKIIKETVNRLSRSIGIHESYVTSCLGVLTGSGVIERSKDSAKLCHVALLKEHDDVRFQNLYEIIEDIGFMNDNKGRYEVNFDLLLERLPVKLATVRTWLNDLATEGYIEYIPPFRGVPTKVLRSDLSSVDFENLKARAADARERLGHFVSFVETPDSEKHNFITEYFDV